MNQDAYKQIFYQCEKFRSAIEVNKEKLGIEWFSRFPRGCCGDTSLILAKYLDEKRFGVAYYVPGMLGPQSHGWLELDGWIIDITADQFDSIEDKILVVQKSYLHEKFKYVKKYSYNELLTGHNYADASLLRAYTIISQTMN